MEVVRWELVRYGGSEVGKEGGREVWKEVGR